MLLLVKDSHLIVFKASARPECVICSVDERSAKAFPSSLEVKASTSYRPKDVATEAKALSSKAESSSLFTRTRSGKTLESLLQMTGA